MDSNQVFGPNERLNSRDREALARDNERMTREALDRANQQVEADRSSGRQMNPVLAAKEAIQGKIERGEMRPNDRV